MTGAGAFADLDKVIEQRVSKTGIGFSAEIRGKNKDKQAINKILGQLQHEDLIKYGLIPEFVGRLPVTAVLDELTEEALVEIMVKPKDALVKQFQALFEMENVGLDFTNSALTAIAHEAAKKKSGARGLRAIIERVLLDVMYEIPSIDNLHKVVIDESVITDHIKPLYVYDNAEKLDGT